MGIYGKDRELVFRDVRQREMIDKEHGIKSVHTFETLTMSPDRKALAFGYYVSNPIGTGFCESSSIWIVNTDGSNPRELFHTDDGCAVPYQWSPDGSKLLAFVSSYSGYYSFVIDVTSGKVTTIAEKDAGGSWSPDGKQIVIPIWNGGWPDKMGLYVVNADGGQPHMIWSAKQVPGDWSGLGNVEWSPDGTKIVFEAYRDVNQVRECYTISPDGTNLTMLVSKCYAPHWSPDGKSLAVLVWNEAEKTNILYVVDHMGEFKPIQRVFEPALWSFDGKALLTVSVGSIEIFEEGRSRRTAGDTLVIFPEEGRILKVPGIERKAPTISMTW